MKTPPPPPPDGPNVPVEPKLEPKPDRAVTCAACGLRSVSRLIVAQAERCVNEVACNGRRRRIARRQEPT